MIAPGLAIALVLVVLGGLLTAVRAAQRRFVWEPELSRKSVHVLMGLVCLTFPWLFRQSWAVWLLAAVAVAGLGAVRLVPQVRSQFGKVLRGVERESWGELLFPPAVAFVFWLSNGDALRFCVPVLILSLADATAALIGRRYGFARYETDDGWKSIEGSASFFVVAFASTAVPLWLWSETGRLECIVIAGIMGFILVLLEAISWRGFDNLFIPVVSYICLARMLPLPVPDLAVRFGVLLAAIGGLAFWRGSTRLTQSAAIGAALILYVSWAVGGWQWLIAPLVTAAGYTYLCSKPASHLHRHSVHAIASIGGIGLFWLCVSSVEGYKGAIYAYGVAYAANLGMIALPWFAERNVSRSIRPAVLKATPLGFVPLALPYLIVWHHDRSGLRLALIAVFLVLGSVALFAVWQPSVASSPTDAARWTRQGLVSATASLAAFGLMLVFAP